MEEETDYTNDFTGYVHAPAGLYEVAAELVNQGWSARARKNTINPLEEHLHIEEELLRLMTRPLQGNTHMLSGQLDLETDAGDEAVEKLAKAFEEMAIPYALQVHDAQGASVVREFGHGSPLDHVQEPAGSGSAAEGGSAGDGNGCLLLLTVCGFFTAAAAALVVCFC